MSSVKCVTLEEELKKNPELKLSDIQILREWCKKQPHLPEIQDVELALFLHSNYYHVEPTKITIENYYTTRTHVPEFFCNRDPLQEKDLQKAFKIAANIPLNGETKDGYKIMYGAFMDTNASNFVYNDNVKYFFMVNDVWVLTKGTNNGYVYFADCSGLSFGHLASVTPMGLKKYLYYIQEAAPIRLKGIHFINASAAMEMLMNMMKPFMKKEMIDMVQYALREKYVKYKKNISLIHFHSSLESASKYVPVKELPNEVGGQAGSIYDLAKIQIKKMEEYREWFLMDEANRRVNEANRIGNSKSASDLFGVEGTFKKLEID